MRSSPGLHSVGWTGLGAFAAQGSVFLRFILVAAFLDPRLLGSYAISGSLVAAAGILGDAGIRQLFIARRADEHSSDLTLLRDSIWFGLAAMRLGIALVSTLLAAVAAELTGLPSSLLIGMTLALGLTGVLNSLGNPRLMDMERRGQFSASVKCEAIGQVTALTVVVICLSHYRSIWLLVLGQAVAAMGSTLLSYLFAPAPGKLRWNWPLLRRLIHHGRHFSQSSVLTYLTYGFDKLLLGVMLSPAQAGLFYMTQRLAEIPGQFFALSFGRIALPDYVVRHEEGGYVRLRARIRMLSLVLVGFFLLAGLIGSLFLRSAALSDGPWAAVRELFAVMLLGTGFRAICHILAPALVVAGRVDLDARLKLMETGLYVLLLPLCVFWFSTEGATAAFALIYVISAINRAAAIRHVYAKQDIGAI